MLPDDGFLGQLRERPDDEPQRLVYADYWDDRGDPRGEFLRLEGRLLALPEGSAEYAGLKARLAEVAAGIDVRWRAAVGRVHVETGPPFAHPRRLSLNVPGPFYTLDDCHACEASEAEAPELLAPSEHEDWTTYFVRQPVTAADILAACRAMSVCCADGVRYAGTDPLVISRLGNTSFTCDYLICDDSPVLIRADMYAVVPPPPVEPPLFERLVRVNPGDGPLALTYAFLKSVVWYVLASLGLAMLADAYAKGRLAPTVLGWSACGMFYLFVVRVVLRRR